MKKLLSILLAALMALAGTVAMAEQAAGAPDDELVVGSTTALSGSFFTEMWGDNTSDIDVRMLLHGYNLIQWNGERGSYGIDPTVVTGISAADDPRGNRTYTITLSGGLTYSDGAPITARDYAFSMLLAASPEVAAIGGETVSSDWIVGVDAYKRGDADVLSGVRVLDDYTLAVTVSAEYRPFFYELGILDVCPYPIAVIAPGCEVADDGDGAYIRNIDPEIEQPIFTAELLNATILDPNSGYLSHPSVVSGPYTLESFDWESRTATFAINEYYKGNADGVKPSIARIVFRTVSPQTMVAELQSGAVDLLHKCVQADVIDAGLALTASGSVAAQSYDRSGFSFVSFNCEQPAVSSAAVRQAIAYCMDKDALVSGYVGNYGAAVKGCYGLGQWMTRLIDGRVAVPLAASDADAGEAATDAQAAWEALSLDGVRDYALDLNAAAALLESDGWTLNREGGAFDPASDDVRCKEIGGELVALDLKLIYPEGNAIGALLETALADNLAQVGVALTVEAVPMPELLERYYRTAERDCDMIYLATNFSYVFEPSNAVNPDDAYQGAFNRTGIADEALYDLAVDMARTEPGDVLSYCQKWVAFQERWAEVLPAIPVYSNTYYDFYTSALQGYDIGANVTWSQAIVGATLSAASAPAETATEPQAFTAAAE